MNLPVKKTSASGIDLWVGDPSCQAAHEALLATLSTLGNFIPPTEELGTRRQGNLGEFISLQVALSSQLPHSRVFGSSAFDPLQNISSAGLDISYAYFDDHDEKNDLLYVQEVKTTGDISLSYANALIKDYEKLFGEDANLTLQTRTQAMAFRLETSEQRPDLATRLRRLAATQPLTCQHVRLIPTIVHELIGADPHKKLLAITSAIGALGWPKEQINGWSIGFQDLISRLDRLARGNE